MTLSKINTGEVLKQYMLWTVAVGWHSATVRWCLVLVSQPTSHEWVLKCAVKEWWGRSGEREVEITSLSQIALLRSKSMLLTRESWSEFNTKCNPVTWSFLFQTCVEMSDTPPKVLLFINPLLLRQPLSMMEVPIFSFESSNFLQSCRHFPTATAWYHWHNCVRLSLSCCLSVTSLSNTNPGSPRCHCCYICMGLSDCCTSAHMCLFSKSTTNVTLNTLDCSSEQPCLLHVAKQT